MSEQVTYKGTIKAYRKDLGAEEAASEYITAELNIKPFVTNNEDFDYCTTAAEYLYEEDIAVVLEDTLYLINYTHVEDFGMLNKVTEDTYNFVVSYYNGCYHLEEVLEGLMNGTNTL